MGASEFDGVRSEIDKLRDGGVPRREEMKVVPAGDRATMTLMCKAIQEENISTGDTLDEWYLPRDELLVIDLASGGDGGSD